MFLVRWFFWEDSASISAVSLVSRAGMVWVVPAVWGRGPVLESWGSEDRVNSRPRALLGLELLKRLFGVLVWVFGDLLDARG